MSKRFDQLLTMEKVEAKVAFTTKFALEIELFYVILEGYSLIVTHDLQGDNFNGASYY